MKTEEEILNEIMKSDEGLIKCLDKKKSAVSRYSGPAQVAIMYEIKMLSDAIGNLRYCTNVIKRKNKEIENLKKENWELEAKIDSLEQTDYGQFLRNKDDIYKTMVNMMIDSDKLVRYLMNVNRLLEIQVEFERLRDEDLEGFDENVINQIKDLFNEFRKYNENFKKNDVGG